MSNFFSNSWITMSMLHGAANWLSIFMFVSGAIGITIGFCGPINHPATAYCRFRYLQIPRSRTVEIWNSYVIPVFMLYLIYLAYTNDWNLVGLFLNFTCTLWVLRTALLKRFPQRGYIHRPFELMFELGELKLIKRFIKH